ncbi:MAG: cytochrome c-type biogenesis protein CcmH [Candidatus Kaistia colombiensis]|nr:MAG: cytochrome c-type biogenesis protein CcmH [Kaistia sp.]
MRRLMLMLGLILSALPAFAVQPGEILKDPALEARARALSVELRCLVCQSQSIDDSDATIAHDLRVLVRERLQAGDSDEAVKAFLVDRYGEYVLLRPRLTWHTIVLWGAPPALLLVGGVLAFGLFRRRRATAATELTQDEQARVEALLAREE